MKQKEYRILEVYAAELRKITLNNGKDLSGGAIFGFHLPEIGCDIDHFVTASANENDFHSLKSVARYLECPVKSAKEFDHRRLIGKRCCLLVRRTRRGRGLELEIARFMFDMSDTFHVAQGRLLFPINDNTKLDSSREGGTF